MLQQVNMKRSSTAKYKNPDYDLRGPYVLADITSPLIRPSLIYEWCGHLPPKGRSWRYTVETLEQMEVEGRIFFPDSGRPKLKRYLSEVVQHDAPLPETPQPSQLEIIVRTAMKAVAAEIARNPRALRQVEWRDLERVLREVFERLGFDTQLTRSGKDGGFDLKLECQQANQARAFLVEVKHWVARAKKPGKAVLAALIDVVASATKGTTGLLLSSSGFTQDVLNGRTEIEQQKVRIGEHSKIVSLCQSYVQSIDGLWCPTSDLADVLLEGTH